MSDRKLAEFVYRKLGIWSSDFDRHYAQDSTRHGKLYTRTRKAYEQIYNSFRGR